MIESEIANDLVEPFEKSEDKRIKNLVFKSACSEEVGFSIIKVEDLNRRNWLSEQFWI